MADTTDDEEEMGVLIAAKDAALKPLHIATSKPARRFYISTALFFVTSLLLLGAASLAYVLFYYTYIPNRGFSRPIHLDFDLNGHQTVGKLPFGIAAISGEIMPGQGYDVSISLVMPRTLTNKAAGNFMLDLQLLAPSASGAITPSSAPTEDEILAHSRRSAIMTYHSDTMEYARRVVGLAWYVLGFWHESETLTVPMLEGAEFARGRRNVPAAVRVELQSEPTLQIYSARVNFTARLRGVRRFMYHWKVTSFLVMTTSFWAVEMGAAASIWLILTFVISPGSKTDETTTFKREPTREPKQEFESREHSDTPRTYPSLSRSHPVAYTPQSQLKIEPSIKSEERGDPPLSEIPPLGAEADDEDEDENADFVLEEPLGLVRGVSDSGIGTSLDSGAETRESVRRRREKQKRERESGG